MTLQEIKQAVISGKTVHWVNERYIVDTFNGVHFYINDKYNATCISLTWTDGTTLNGSEDQFYTA